MQSCSLAGYTILPNGINIDVYNSIDAAFTINKINTTNRMVINASGELRFQGQSFLLICFHLKILKLNN